MAKAIFISILGGKNAWMKCSNNTETGLSGSTRECQVSNGKLCVVTVKITGLRKLIFEFG